MYDLKLLISQAMSNTILHDVTVCGPLLVAFW